MLIRNTIQNYIYFMKCQCKMGCSSRCSLDSFLLSIKMVGLLIMFEPARPHSLNVSRYILCFGDSWNYSTKKSSFVNDIFLYSNSEVRFTLNIPFTGSWSASIRSTRGVRTMNTTSVTTGTRFSVTTTGCCSNVFPAKCSPQQTSWSSEFQTLLHSTNISRTLILLSEDKHELSIPNTLRTKKSKKFKLVLMQNGWL